MKQTNFENLKKIPADIKLEKLSKTTKGLVVNPKTQVELSFVLDLSFKPFKTKIMRRVNVVSNNLTKQLGPAMASP